MVVVGSLPARSWIPSEKQYQTMVAERAAKDPPEGLPPRDRISAYIPQRFRLVGEEFEPLPATQFSEWPQPEFVSRMTRKSSEPIPDDRRQCMAIAWEVEKGLDVSALQIVMVDGSDPPVPFPGIEIETRQDRLIPD